MSKSTNIVWHNASVTRTDRNEKNGHASFVLWFTGLSGSGKSTVANATSALLFEQGHQVYVLDGDNVRHGLNKDLGFSETDRVENIRRIGEVSKLFVDAGTIVLTAFISPFRADRALVRELLGADHFVEVFVDCPLEECERRDVKGLYAKARRGEIKHFTGIDSPYEAPEAAEIIVRSDQLSVEQCAHSIVEYLYTRGLVREKE
ncbi:MAG: adenylyl-sulfate kinase [Bacilli bacterium]